MIQPPSPFCPGRPLRSDQPIFGRDEVFAFIHGQLASYGSVNLIGERRLGKTSVLHHLLDHPEHRPPAGDPPLFLVELDLQRSVTNSKRFYGLALQEILRHVRGATEFSDATKRLAELEHLPDADFAEFEGWLKRLKDASALRVVLLVDEFERLLDAHFRAGFPIPVFFDGLRSLLTADLLAVVVASRLPLSEHFEHHPEAMTSTFPTYLTPCMLEELDASAAERLLMQGLGAGLVISQIQLAGAWAGCHPCRLQSAGQAWYEARHQNKDAPWAKGRYHQLADQCCLVRVPRPPVRSRLRAIRHNLAQLLRWLGINLPTRLGTSAKWLGAKLGDTGAMVTGYLIILTIVLVVIGVRDGRVSVEQVVDWVAGVWNKKP